MDFKTHLAETLGEKLANELIDSLDKKPYISFRSNSLKTLDNKEYQDFCANYEKHIYVDNAYYANKKMGNNPYHHAGAYYIQEASAMLVGELLPIDSNDKVLDLCAAPGGKSSHVAARLNNTGLIISNDISYPRAKILSENIERMGIRNAFVTSNTIDDFISYQGFFDKIILDAPCSGEGMFRKNELVEEDWTFNKVLACASIQKDLILKAYKLLKKDGLMIYSTCTFAKQEDEDVIKYLLENTNASLIRLPDIKGVDRGINLDEALRILPNHFKGEGHFICLIKCNDDHESLIHNYKQPKIRQDTLKLIKDFANNNLTYKLDENRIYINKDLVYYLKDNFVPDKLKVLRYNLLLGEIYNNRFIPSHALAISSMPNGFKNVLDLDDSNIFKYLHGETLPCNYKGYTLVTYKGISIGLGKASNGILKNLYPKGLRK